MKHQRGQRIYRAWGTLALILLCSAGLSGCANGQQSSDNETANNETNLGEVTRDEAQSQIDAWVEANDGQTLEVHIDSDDTYIGCPSTSICDENYDYRAFIVAEHGFRLRLSFDAIIANEISLDLLNDHFDVLSLSYEPPELNFENWRIRLGGDVALRANDDNAVAFTGWENDRVQGKITTTLTNVSGYVTEDDTLGAADPDCFLMDTQVPDECSIGADASILLVLTFDLPLSTGTLDCSGSDQPKGCGNSIH